MAESKSQVRSERLEQGSVKPSSAPEVVRWTGPDLTSATEFVQSFSRSIGRRFGTHRPSLGEIRWDTPATITNETVAGPVEIVREGAD